MWNDFVFFFSSEVVQTYGLIQTKRLHLVWSVTVLCYKSKSLFFLSFCDIELHKCVWLTDRTVFPWIRPRCLESSQVVIVLSHINQAAAQARRRVNVLWLMRRSRVHSEPLTHAIQPHYFQMLLYFTQTTHFLSRRWAQMSVNALNRPNYHV